MKRLKKKGRVILISQADHLSVVWCLNLPEKLAFLHVTMEEKRFFSLTYSQKNEFSLRLFLFMKNFMKRNGPDRIKFTKLI